MLFGDLLRIPVISLASLRNAYQILISAEPIATTITVADSVPSQTILRMDLRMEASVRESLSMKARSTERMIVISRVSRKMTKKSAIEK
jgi:hypothetical protein